MGEEVGDVAMCDDWNDGGSLMGMKINCLLQFQLHHHEKQNTAPHQIKKIHLFNSCTVSIALRYYY